MKIKVNGKEEIIANEVTVKDLLSILKVKSAEYVTVQLNDNILIKEDYENTKVKDGDVVEFLYFMGGGSR